MGRRPREVRTARSCTGVPLGSLLAGRLSPITHIGPIAQRPDQNPSGPARPLEPVVQLRPLGRGTHSHTSGPRTPRTGRQGGQQGGSRRVDLRSRVPEASGAERLPRGLGSAQKGRQAGPAAVPCPPAHLPLSSPGDIFPPVLPNPLRILRSSAPVSSPPFPPLEAKFSHRCFGR